MLRKLYPLIKQQHKNCQMRKSLPLCFLHGILLNPVSFVRGLDDKKAIASIALHFYLI